MLKMKKFNLGPLETNCYLLYKGKEAIVIDPGGDPEVLLDYINNNGLTLKAILNTHLHFDHIQGNAELSSQTKAPVLSPEKDRFLLSEEVGAGGFMGLPKTPEFEFQNLESGETSFLGSTCHILNTPGHTPGSLSFFFPDLEGVFVGDLLFHRSVGRTDFPGGDAEVLKQSAREQIFVLPDNTTIYSGHGLDSRVLDEKLHNPFFHENSFF
ncbi:MAG: MBL fold metallo-hydrolase [Desulfonatronovibrio sp. MSAO_Bac4]|nr:MAG: MBL fold metallo-hydrolase [Desulfonatronovibrio sp. MSAO_Bac4]